VFTRQYHTHTYYGTHANHTWYYGLLYH